MARKPLTEAQKAVKRERRRAWRMANREGVRERKRAWRAANPDRQREYDRAKYAANPDVQRKSSRKWRAANREHHNAYKRGWRAANPERVRSRTREYNRKWKSANSERVREYERERRRTNIQFKLSKTLRTRLRSAVRNGAKGGSAVRDLGCTIVELKIHLEQQFTPGMTWDNWALDGWHIDHIRPLASFDLADPAQVKVACHFTNLQPLWAKENLAKGDNCSEAA